MMALASRAGILVLLSIGCAPTASATRRAAVSMTLGTRTHARVQMEEERMRREGEEIRRAASNMTLEGARAVLTQGGAAAAELVSMVNKHLASKASGGQKLRSQAVDFGKARTLLNKMINEVFLNLDKLKIQCSSFFRKQCSLMEITRSELSDANSEAAHWRGKVVWNQKCINVCEFRLPHLKGELQVNIIECNKRLAYLRADLAVVMNDLGVMTRVLEMTECNTETPKGMTLVQCEHPCTKQSFLAFQQEDLNKKLQELKSSRMRQLVQQTIRDIQTPVPYVPRDKNGKVIVNVTVFDNPPLAQEPLPGDPCAGISYDAGGVAGCTLHQSPNCFNLQNKFINIQGEIVDHRDRLELEIADLLRSCKQTQKELGADIEYFQGRHDTCSGGLAEATGEEDEAVKEASSKGTQHEHLEKAMLKSRTECTETMRQYESELCALRKIRGEFFKVKGDKTNPPSVFFQDCEVSEWREGQCSKSCGGGIQVMYRGILAFQYNEGASCPPFYMRRGCNEHPCKIDCVVGTWSRFSECTAKCGGGVRERVRRVKVHPRYGGDPCGDLTETEACNIQSCSRDCQLGHWGKYTPCTKACDGGIKFAFRTVKAAAIGDGRCPWRWSKRRLRIVPCNPIQCPTAENDPLKCKGKVDLVMLLDGSASIGDKGWTSTINFAKKITESFDGEDVQVSVILFSGPKTWGDYDKCNGELMDEKALYQTCGVKLLQHFKTNMKETKEALGKLKFPEGSTFTAKALELAKAELTTGRPDATPIVLLMTDGIPISQDKAGEAAAKVRDSARLIVGAVAMNQEGMGLVQKWASYPTRDNVLKIGDFKTMEKTSTINGLVRDMCKGVELKATTTTAAPAASGTR